MDNYRKLYEAWLHSDTIDEASKDELRGLTDESEIAFRFPPTWNSVPEACDPKWVQEPT